MNARASLTARLMSASAWRDALLDWARTDGLTWIYILKTVSAALLALGIAMKLELPQPHTAMMTVFIVMQPQSGMVLAKGFYRIAGTLVGSLVTIVLIALFSQQPTLFLLSVSIWVGICTFGAACNRNFRSYGFVLAGYTAALVGIPAAQHADGAFMAAVTRVTEVTLGIICAGTVSALVLPQHAGDTVRTVVRARYARFVEFVADTLAGRVDRAGAEQINARFVADVVGLEALRSFAVFEDPRTRMRGVKAMNVEWRPWIADFPECGALNQHQIIHVGIMQAVAPTRIVRTKQTTTYFLACFGGECFYFIDRHLRESTHQLRLAYLRSQPRRPRRRLRSDLMFVNQSDGDDAGLCKVKGDART